MQFELITEVTKKYGVIGAISVIVLFILWNIIKSTWFTERFTRLIDFLIQKILRKKINSKETFSEIDKSAILNHDLFESIDFWIYSKLPTYEFSSKYRTIIFHKYLKIYLRKYKSVVKAYVDGNSYENMDSAEFWNSLKHMINQIIHDYEEEMQMSGIPDIIIHKMRQKNNSTLHLMIDLMGGICESKFHDSKGNLLKLHSILNIIFTILERTILDSVKVCDSINGELAGLQIVENGTLYVEPPSIH